MSQRKRQAPSLPGLPRYSSSESSSSSEPEPEDYKTKVNQGAVTTQKVAATQGVAATQKVAVPRFGAATQEVGPNQKVEPNQEAAAAPGCVGYIWPPPGSPTEKDEDEPKPELDPLSDDIDWDNDEEALGNDGNEDENEGEPQTSGVVAPNAIIIQPNPVDRIFRTPSSTGTVYSFPDPELAGTDAVAEVVDSAASSPLGAKSPTPPPPSPGPPANKPKERGMPAGIAPRAGHQHAETGMEEDDAPDAAVARAVAAAKKRKREEEEKNKRKAPPRKKVRVVSPEEEDDDELSDAPSNPEPPSPVAAVVEKGKKPRKQKNNNNNNGKKEGTKPKPGKATLKKPTKNTPKGSKGKKGEGMERKKCTGTTTKGEPCKNQGNVKEGDEYNCGKHKPKE